MGNSNSSAFRHRTQGVGSPLAEVKAILDSVDTSALIARLWAYRWNGRPGHSLTALWRAHLLRYLLNLPSINALILRLRDDPRLRRLCGFSHQLPHRSTFNRFYSRLSHHQDLVEKALASITNQLQGLLPGFGEKIAVDSTNVPTYSSPRKPTISDSEASWTAKSKPTAKSGKDWHFGYKYHAVADAQYGLPIIGFTTTASRHDSPELPSLLDKASKTHAWFSPTYCMADKGYDAQQNHRAILDCGAIPILPIKSKKNGELYEGVYNNDGAPTCMGLRTMEYVKQDPERGALFRCPAEGCHLKDRRGVRYCQDELWEHKPEDPRRFGPLSRSSPLWKALYGLRQSVERVFKSLKQSRALASHHHRGLLKVGLHACMSVLAFQATALRRLRAGQVRFLRWQVPKVA